MALDLSMAVVHLRKLIKGVQSRMHWSQLTLYQWFPPQRTIAFRFVEPTNGGKNRKKERKKKARLTSHVEHERRRLTSHVKHERRRLTSHVEQERRESPTTSVTLYANNARHLTNTHPAYSWLGSLKQIHIFMNMCVMKQIVTETNDLFLR